MKTAILLPLMLLASNAEAQNKFFSSTWGRSPMGAKYAAILSAGDGVVLAKGTELADIEADITARNACNNAGRVYLPASPDADAGGCVDPSIWGVEYQLFTKTCVPSPTGGVQDCNITCLDQGPDWQPAPEFSGAYNQCNQEYNGGYGNGDTGGCTGCTWQSPTGMYGKASGATYCRLQWFNTSPTRAYWASIACKR